MQRRFGWILLSAALALSCSEDSDGTKILTAEHDGWKDPVCADCHPDHHNSELDYHECVECHGTNGAIEQPTSGFHTVTCGDAAAGGPGCHASEHDEADAGFPPGDCITCHPPASM